MNQPQHITINGEMYNFEELIRNAESGNFALMAIIADALVLGKYGAQKDEARGWQYYQRAAGGGDSDALFQVGLACLNGTYFKKDQKLAERYLQSAADAGHKDAQYIYGITLKAEKPSKSVHYFELSAMQGHDKAQYQLGYYFLFEGKNIESAIYWLCHSSLRGNVDADKALNLMVQPQAGIHRASERIRDTFVRIQKG